MAPNSRYWLAFVCGTLAIGSTMTARSTPGGDAAACVELREWARPYANTQPTLDELATLDRAHRIAVFNVVTPEVKAALWHEQHRRFARRSDLSAAQRALINEGSTLVTAALYRHEPSAARAFVLFQAKIALAFPTVESRRVWYDLGAIAPNGDAIERPMPSTGRVNCNCKTSMADDCGGFTCGASACGWLPSGCGAMGVWPCDGRCR